MRHLGRLLALLLVALLGASCPQPTGTAVTWAESTVTITVTGPDRDYLVVRPAGTASSPLPVLMELHGCCTTPAYELERSGFEDVTGPAILVFPAGYQQHWNAGACCATSAVDDVAFLTAVLHQVLTRQAGADPRRVYLVGYSNGGRMAYKMACAQPGLFAAVAVFGAVDAQACVATPALSMLIGAGTGDAELTIPAGGVRKTTNGYLEPTVEAEVAGYVRAGGCTAAPRTSTIGALTTTTWASCGSGKTVELALYQGGDHSWPAVDGATPGISAVMWTFFQKPAAGG
jgi:polyhydroxybutyrate depolymerase